MKRCMCFLCIFFCLALCGCKADEVSDKAYAKLMAIEKDGGNITVYVKLMYADDGETESVTVSGSGENIGEALINAQRSCKKKINLGHCDMIIFDKRLNNLTEQLLPLVKERTISPVCNVAVSDNCDILIGSDDEISGMAQVLSDMGDFSPVTAAQYLSDELSDKQYSVLPILEYDGEKLVFGGLAAVRNGRCVTGLSVQAQSGLNLLHKRYEKIRSVAMADGSICRIKINSLSVKGRLPYAAVVLDGTLCSDETSPFVAAYALKKDIENELMTLYSELTGIKKTEQDIFSPVMNSISSASAPAPEVTCNIE